MTTSNENLEPMTPEALLAEFQQALFFYQNVNSGEHSKPKKNSLEDDNARQVRITSLILARHNVFYLATRGEVTFDVLQHIPRISLAESTFQRAVHLNRKFERRVPPLPPSFELLGGESDTSAIDPKVMTSMVPG